ncbi:MAG TPA: ferritin-like domain-containing protein [Flavipsychrobacter sp.]|nr:ferritin-like domain-containing protein [Flavipsychrobacter sp.]
MNFSNILNEISKADPEVFGKMDDRRSVLKNITRKVALTALPLALGTTFNKAYGQSNGTVIKALNYALGLEHLEAAFYKEALAAINAGAFPTISPASPAYAALDTIYKHETAHVAFLTSVINSMSPNAAVAAATYDFTVGGQLPTFTDYTILLAVAQVLEDTGVRAYKGQANASLMGSANSEVLTAALNIHSVEARHASHIRQMRATSAGGGASVKPWITLAQSGITAPSFANFDGNYTGEELTVQGTPAVNIVNIGASGITAAGASEAFDEGLTDVQVAELVKPFIVVA